MSTTFSNTARFTPRTLNEALSIIETQTRVITLLQSERDWYNSLVFNPSFNETDMRLAVYITPQEMRMGLTSEEPERKIWLPTVAEQVHASEKTVSKRLRNLAKETSAFSYRTAKDEETGNTRVYLQPLPPLEKPDTITIERVKPGGSTWEDGHRVKRCEECDSPHLVKETRTRIVCKACSHVQFEATTSHQVNDPDSLLEEQTPNSHNDTDPQKEQEREADPQEAHSHNDTEVSAPDEIPNVPPCTDSTLVGSTEPMEPPAWLQSLKIWCCHRAKEPFQSWGRNPQRAKVNDPATWGTYEQAKRMYEDSVRWGWKEPFDGIGLMCDGTFTVLDYDHCIEDGRVDTSAWNRALQVNSYMERSYSGTGIHQIAKGSIPTGRKRPDIEMYSGGPGKGRFLTWTGQHIAGTPTTIEDRQEQITALYGQITPKASAPLADLPRPSGQNFPPCDDEEIIRKASNAKNGAKFRKLWSGDASDYLHRDGTPDQSSADLALCSLLAYWTDGSVDSIDRLFRQSGLMRDKWERADYREGTLCQVLGRSQDDVA